MLFYLEIWLNISIPARFPTFIGSLNLEQSCDIWAYHPERDIGGEWPPWSPCEGGAPLCVTPAVRGPDPWIATKHMIVWFAWHVGISVTVLKRPHTEQDSSPFTFLSRTQTQWMTCISHNHTVLLRVCSCGYCYVWRNRGNMVCLSFHLSWMHKVYFLVTTMISRCPAEVSKFQSCWIIAQPWMTSCLICFSYIEDKLTNSCSSSTLCHSWVSVQIIHSARGRLVKPVLWLAQS